MTKFITKLDELRILIEARIDEKIIEIESNGRFDNLPQGVQDSVRSYVEVLEMIKILEQENE